MFLPSSFISSSESFILYFCSKSSLAIFFVISFNCKIGFVNLRDITDAAKADINIVITPIVTKVVFEILTLSSIGAIGILIYRLYPLSNFPYSKI